MGPEPCSNRIFSSQVVNVLTHIAVTGLNLRHQTSVVSMYTILSLSGMIRTHMTQSLPQGSSPLFKISDEPSFLKILQEKTLGTRLHMVLSLETKEERLLEQGWAYFGLQGQERPSVSPLGVLSYQQATVWDHTSV